MTSSPGRRADVIAVAILAGILTLLCLDVLAGINVLYARDIAHYYYPAKHVLREIVLGGEFPYWNPYFGAGQPMAANPEHEVFYPLTWMILLPNFRVAVHLLVLLHVYVASDTSTWKGASSIGAPLSIPIAPPPFSTRFTPGCSRPCWRSPASLGASAAGR